MIVLTAIGRFFKKIWDWIRQTAWIQPLLIVGIIFGVIFSIPSIVKAAKNKKEANSKAEAYYHNFQISLELDDENDPKSSKADKFTYALETAILDATPENIANFKSTCKELKIETGDKFFFAYVAQDCDKCAEARPGFEVFEKNLNKNDYFKTNDGLPFNMVTIFADEETSYTKKDDESAFVQYLDRHTSFFEEVGSNAYNTAYFDNGKLSESDLEALSTADPVNFLTPTIMLVEFQDNAVVGKGVTEVLFGVGSSSDDQNKKAEILLDCWKHTGDFNIND